MPEENFRTTIYQVGFAPDSIADGTEFGVAIMDANALDWGARYQEDGDDGHRLQRVEWQGACQVIDLWSFNFVGPSRARPHTVGGPFQMDADERFTTSVAILYDPEEGLAFVESKPKGAGPGAIARYFGAYAQPGTKYQLTPRLDDDAAARARGFQTIRSARIRASTGPVTDADREAGFDPIKGFGDGLGAGTVEVVLKSYRPRNRTLDAGRVWDAFDALLGDDDHTVEVAQIYGKEHDDDSLELVDLIQHREKRLRLLDVDDGSRSIPIEMRWEALAEIRRAYLP